MKKLSILILSLLIISLVSCKKESYHKLRFEVIFLQDCHECYADYIGVLCKPRYMEDDEPYLAAGQVEQNSKWEYTYNLLKNGDEVEFVVQPGESATYVYEMRIFVDDIEVSYRKCYGPYGFVVIDEKGLNNNTNHLPYINFTYQE